MYHELINATDLKKWADEKDAEQYLPELVKRLVYSSIEVTDLKENYFPSLDGVNSPGWDGYTETQIRHTYIPLGVAGWEMGKNKAYSSKAEKDYLARTSAIEETERAKINFIFVTPRRWPSKKVWSNGKEDLKEWKSVTVIDGTDLATWLEQYVQVHLWITEIIKGELAFVKTLESWWSNFANVTEPAIASEFLLSGRRNNVEDIYKYLNSKENTLSVSSRTIDEVIAFIYAALKTLDENNTYNYVSKAIIVESDTTYKRLIASSDNLILIPTFKNLDISLVGNSSIKLLIPTTVESDLQSNHIALASLDAEVATDALKDIGFEANKAYELARVAKKNLLSFRRKIAIHPDLLMPDWFNSQDGANLVPALLAGSWSDKNEMDKSIIESIAGQDYGTYEYTLSSWKNSADPPILCKSNVWKIISIEDSVKSIQKFITESQSQNFVAALSKVTKLEDPSFELSTEDRWLANVKGYKMPYSDEIREGLLSSIAALASKSGNKKVADGAYTYHNIADRFVREVGQWAESNPSGKNWYSLRNLLSFLAEASPDMYLNAIETDLGKDTPILLNLFTSDSNYFSSSPHTELLFSLEKISWNNEYLSRVVVVLTKLSAIDPGGNTSNRPFNSLYHILNIIRPQCTAGADERVKLIDLVCRTDESIGKKLLLQLIPNGHGIIMGSAEPRFRDWKPLELPPVTYQEVYMLLGEVISKLLKLMNSSNGREWSDLLDEITNLPEKDFDQVVESITSLPVDSFTESDRELVWNKIRSIISRHREHPNAKWAYPMSKIDQLDSLYQALTPTDIIAQYSWLFTRSHMIELLNPSTDGWQKNEEIAKSLRDEAIREIYAKLGVEGLMSLAKKAGDPYMVGYSIPGLPTDENELILQKFNTDYDLFASFLNGYVTKRVFDEGLVWVNESISIIESNPKADIGKFLNLAPTSPDLWKLVIGKGASVESSYWSRVSPYGLGADFTGYLEASKMLLKHGRPFEAIAAACYVEGKKIQSEYIATLLNKAALANPTGTMVDIQMITHYVSQLIKRLHGQNYDPDKTLKIEITWFTALKTDRHDIDLEIYKRLNSEPAFFVELINNCYKPSNEKRKKLNSKQLRVVELSNDILDRWHSVPGREKDNEYDSDKLRDWVVAAIQLLQESDRVSPGRYSIGKMLYRTPRNSNEGWPSNAVCAVIEDIIDERIEDGMVDAAYNTQGFISKAEDDSKARANVIEQRATEITADYPNTARMLRRMSSALISRSENLFRDDD